MDSPGQHESIRRLTPQEERQLWSLAEGGDEEANLRLLTSIREVARRTLIKRFGAWAEPADIDDAVQEAATEWLRDKYEPRRSLPSTYFVLLAKSSFERFRRNEQRRREAESRRKGSGTEERELIEFDDSEWLKVRTAIDALSTVERAVFLGKNGLRQTSTAFVRCEEETYRMLDTRLGLPDRTAERRHSDALDFLRPKLGPLLGAWVDSATGASGAGGEAV